MPNNKNNQRWRAMKHAIEQKKKIKLYKSMNAEDIKARQAVEYKIQNLDYQLTVLRAQETALITHENALLQFDCYGFFCGMDKETSMEMVKQAQTYIIGKRAELISQLAKLP